MRNGSYWTLKNIWLSFLRSPYRKVTCFWFGFNSLTVIHVYLNDKSQVTKSVFFTVKFHILFTVLYYHKLDFSNYADDTTPYNCKSTFLETMSDLEILLGSLLNCFCYKTFKACASKCHLFLSPFNEKSVNTKSSLIEGSSSEKRISITIDNSNFIFENINLSFLAKTV